MKEMKQWLMVAAVVALCGMMMTGCKGNAQRPVKGTIDETVEIAMEPQDAPQAVFDAMKHDKGNIDDRYETLMEDKTTGVAVYSLLKCSDTISSEGYGIVVAKGDVKTALPQMRHGRMPRAHYDPETGDLVILGSVMEGTGVNVEMPYFLRFEDNGYANVVGVINPYELQELLCKALTYSIDGQDITFYANGKELVTVTNQITDMGGFMDDAIYVGEQISYSIEGPLTVHITPGLNFVVGKVLHYDDMPTLSVPITVNHKDHSIELGDFTVEQ